MPNLWEAFDEYGKLSNLKVNWGKSSGLNINLQENLVENLQRQFHFDWSKKGLQYLGVKLAASIQNIFQLNFPPFLSKVRADLGKWDTKQYSWFGRSAILKMTILPRMLYLLQTLPIPIYQSYLKTLRTEFMRFLWAGKMRRIRRTIITMPKDRGGLGVPDPVLYHLAIHYQRALEWCRHIKEKSWVQIEQAQCSFWLGGAPWLDQNQIKQMQSNPLVDNTIKVIKSAKLSLITKGNSRMMPLTGNPAFPPGDMEQSFNIFLRGETERRRVGFFCNRDRHFTIEEIQGAGDPPMTRWNALQLQHFLQKLFPRGAVIPTCTKFEETCMETGPIRHGLSLIYQWLTHPPKGVGTDNTVPFISNWEEDLNRCFSPQQKKRMIEMTHRASISNRIQENGYKILTRWYLTPQRLSRMFPGTSDMCWRCNQHKGTIFHIFWTCPKIVPFWREVSRWCEELTGIKLKQDPAIYLLHLAPLPMGVYKRSLLLHLLNAAKCCIPICWKQINPPSVGLWFSKINEIFVMEEFVAKAHDKDVQLRGKWQIWIDFIQTKEFNGEVE